MAATGKTQQQPSADCDNAVYSLELLYVRIKKKWRRVALQDKPEKALF